MRFSKKQQSGSTLLFFFFWKRILSSRYLPNVPAPLTDSSLHWKTSIKIKKTVSDYKSFATTRKVSFWTFTIRHIVSSSRTTREESTGRKICSNDLSSWYTNTASASAKFHFTQKNVHPPRYLSAIAQAVSGETAKNIIDKHVILEIKVLLESTDLTYRK